MCGKRFDGLLLSLAALNRILIAMRRTPIRFRRRRGRRNFSVDALNRNLVRRFERFGRRSENEDHPREQSEDECEETCDDA